MYTFIAFLGSILVVLMFMWTSTKNYYIKLIRPLEVVQRQYQDSMMHGLVDVDMIKDNYYFTGIKCTLPTRKQCFIANLPKFYDNNGNLKLKQVVYFLNDNLTFDLTGDWYKDYANIQELYAKVKFGFFTPSSYKNLGTSMGIKQYNIAASTPEEISRFLLTPFWFQIN